MSRRQRDHAGEYARGLRARRGKNLSDKVCHGCAAASAGEKFGLEPDEREAVDARPDEKCPERTKKDEPVVDFPLRANVPTMEAKGEPLKKPPSSLHSTPPAVVSPPPDAGRIPLREASGGRLREHLQGGEATPRRRVSSTLVTAPTLKAFSPRPGR